LGSAVDVRLVARELAVQANRLEESAGVCGIGLFEREQCALAVEPTGVARE